MRFIKKRVESPSTRHFEATTAPKNLQTKSDSFLDFSLRSSRNFAQNDKRFYVESSRFDKYDLYFLLVVLLNLIALIYLISGASVGYHEAVLVRENKELIAKLANLSIAHFGAHIGIDYALKLPNLIFYALNLVLIYLISNCILKFKRDSVLCVGIFALIPGVIMQGSIVNRTIPMLFVVLVICYCELRAGMRGDLRISSDSNKKSTRDSSAKNVRDLRDSSAKNAREIDSSDLGGAKIPTNHKATYPLMLLATFMGQSAFMLCLALFFYTLSLISRQNFKRDLRHTAPMLLWAIFCFGLNLYLFGGDISGRPRGQSLDTIAELALLYSPPLFVYFIYAIYRNFAKYKANLLLYVSGVSIVLSVLLSIRQDVNKEIYMFMSLCGIPLMVRQMLSDIRLRLPAFQEGYKKRFFIVIAVLLVESSALILSKQIYRFTNESEIFLNQFYIAREVASELKARGISRVSVEGRMQERLAFYGIKDGGQKLRKVKRGGNIAIKYHDKIVARYAI